MSFVLISPDLVSAAAADLNGIGSTLTAANAAAAGPTTTVLAAAQDEVSTASAQLFGMHAREFQAIGARAAAFHA
jgi:PE family protein